MTQDKTNTALTCPQNAKDDSGEEIIDKTELALMVRTRMFNYIRLIMSKKPDGSMRTKKEAALEAGYSESVANNVACDIEGSQGFSRMMKAYFDLNPNLDYRAVIVSRCGDILSDPTTSPKDFVNTARYYSDIQGDFAPKKTQSLNVKVNGQLPHRED